MTTKRDGYFLCLGKCHELELDLFPFQWGRLLSLTPRGTLTVRRVDKKPPASPKTIKNYSFFWEGGGGDGIRLTAQRKKVRFSYFISFRNLYNVQVGPPPYCGNASSSSS